MKTMSFEEVFADSTEFIRHGTLIRTRISFVSPRFRADIAWTPVNLGWKTLFKITRPAPVWSVSHFRTLDEAEIWIEAKGNAVAEMLRLERLRKGNQAVY